MFYSKNGPIEASTTKIRGFTLIELMIVIAIIAIILTLALPVYSNYTIRAKVGEALSVSAAAKTSVADTCQASPEIASLTPEIAGVALAPTLYVSGINVSGPCTDPVITVTTQNTGATENPVLLITGQLGSQSGHMSWKCTTSGQKIYVPRTCRGS
jgi:type IV pilus assembly protein PilA